MGHHPWLSWQCSCVARRAVWHNNFTHYECLIEHSMLASGRVALYCIFLQIENVFQNFLLIKQYTVILSFSLACLHCMLVCNVYCVILLYFVGPTPWYDNYRDDFIQLIKQSDHEYIRHYMGCILCGVYVPRMFHKIVSLASLIPNLLTQLY